MEFWPLLNPSPAGIEVFIACTVDGPMMEAFQVNPSQFKS